jgi:hypothetical protein
MIRFAGDFVTTALFLTPGEKQARGKIKNEK